MEKGGKILTLNPEKVNKLGRKNLVSNEQQKSIKKEKISFSFLYFRQIDLFGAGNCSQGWHIGLLERLSAFGGMNLDELLNEKGSKSLRCHPIDWNAKNVPITRNELNWLPADILDNDAEFPMIQLSISTGTGRIVGFFNRDSSVFHIVLLDPNHNIQPSRYDNYQLQPTTIGLSQYDELLNKLDNIKKIVKDCQHGECKLHSRIEEIESLHDNIIYTGLDKSIYEAYKEVLSKYTLQEIIEMGTMELIGDNTALTTLSKTTND